MVSPYNATVSVNIFDQFQNTEFRAFILLFVSFFLRFLKLKLKSSKDEEQYTLMMDESDNIDEDFKRLAVDNVGPELAQIAFEQWYPLVNEDKNEIKEIIIKNFEDYKVRNRK